MMTQIQHPIANHVLHPRTRYLLGAGIILMLFGLLLGGAVLPFWFESSSLFYKFGMDRIMLQAGKVFGIVSGMLLLLQLFWSARIRFLDRIFGLNNLLGGHRLAGIVLAGCALVHPLLVYLPDNSLFIPLTMRYWPELLGLALLIGILGMAFTATFRASVHLPYEYWRPTHHFAAILVSTGLVVHVLYVSETFAHGVPRALVIGAIALWGGLWAWMCLRRLLLRMRPQTISEVQPVGRDALSLRVAFSGQTPLEHAPGQFAFVRVIAPGVRAEEHPFTIASAPGQETEFIIRACGDWTRAVTNVSSGGGIVIDGPYGLFSHQRCRDSPELILIAGGIGITPMLSMLRHLAANRDVRRITLVWSNKTRDHVVHGPEFPELESRLPGLWVHYLFTRESVDGQASARLDHAALESLLADCDRKSALFLCGPPGMIVDLQRILPSLGFSRWRIYTERFSF